MAGKECKMQRTRLKQHEHCKFECTFALLFVCPEHSHHSHCLVDHHSIPGLVVKFWQGSNFSLH